MFTPVPRRILVSYFIPQREERLDLEHEKRRLLHVSLHEFRGALMLLLDIMGERFSVWHLTDPRRTLRYYIKARSNLMMQVLGFQIPLVFTPLSQAALSSMYVISSRIITQHKTADLFQGAFRAKSMTLKLQSPARSKGLVVRAAQAP